jgi:hypothetical protein
MYQFTYRVQGPTFNENAFTDLIIARLNEKRDISDALLYWTGKPIQIHCTFPGVYEVIILKATPPKRVDLGVQIIDINVFTNAKAISTFKYDWVPAALANIKAASDISRKNTAYCELSEYDFSTEGRFDNILSSGFSWQDSPEGMSFWSKKAAELRNRKYIEMATLTKVTV